MLKARLATGFILIAIFLAAVFLAPEKLWWALVAIVMAIAAHEWARLAGLTGAAALAYAAVTLAFAASALWYPGYSSRAVIYAAAAVFWLVVAPLWLWRRWSPTGVAIVAVAGWLVLVPTALALIDLRKGGGGFMLALMATVWIADSAAYFAGRRFGKRKLAPQISPGKTWEGVAGALLAVAIYAAGLFMLFHYQLGFVFALLLLVPLARANCHLGRGDFHMSATGRLRRRRPGGVAPFVYTGIQMVSKRLFEGELPEGPFSTNILWDRAIDAARCYGTMFA